MRNRMPEWTVVATRMVPGRSVRVGSTLLLMALACAALLISGCGGDKEEAAPEATARALVPAHSTIDSLSTPASAVPGEAAAPAADGNSSPGQAVEPVAEPAAAAVPKAAPTVREAAAKADVAAAPVFVGSGPYSIQVGSFQNRTYAQARADKIRTAGFEPVIETADVAGVTYYRVLVSGFADRAAANDAGEMLRAQLDLSYLVKRDD